MRHFPLTLLPVFVLVLLLLPDSRAYTTSTDRPTWETRSHAAPLPIGVMMHPLHDPYDATQIVQRLNLADALGVTLVRIDIHWAWIEPTGPGHWNTDQTARLNTFLDAAARRNLQVLAVVMDAPCWASSDPQKDCATGTYDGRYPPADPQAFATFVGTLAATFHDRIQQWEVWYAPNHRDHWITPDAAAYTALLHAAYPAIKAQSPDALVLGGSLTPSDGAPENPVNATTYLAAMYQAGAHGFFDALAYQPYTDGHPPTWYDVRWPMHSFAQSIPALHQVMRNAGDTRSIWLTETGWTTVSTACDDCWTPDLPTSEAEQAAYLAEAVALAQEWDYVAGVIWYELVDRGGPAALGYADHFGLLRHDLTLKPAADQLRTLTASVAHLRMGVNLHPLQDTYAPDSSHMAHQIALLQEINAAVVRIDIHWAWIESDGPGTATWNQNQIARLDAFLDACAGTGMTVLATVLETPCWATTDPVGCDAAAQHGNYPPATPAAYATFVGHLVQRYQGRIHYWEVWNEPNLPAFWANPDPVAYTALLQATYPVIKAHDPHALVLGGSLAPANGTVSPPVLATDYLAAMYQAGVQGFFDRLAYHPYTDGNRPTWYDPQWPTSSYVSSVPDIRQVMQHAGDTRPIWLTEIGWTTVDPETCADCWTPILATTEAAQSAYLGEVFQIAGHWEGVEAVLWYELIDTIAPDRPDVDRYDHHFGLFRRDGSSKPAAAQFQHLSRLTRPHQVFLPLVWHWGGGAACDGIKVKRVMVLVPQSCHD